jgi:hypothetical protein
MNPYRAQTKNYLGSTWGRLASLAVAAALLVPSVSCTSQQNTGTSPAYLILTSLTAAPGAKPDEFGGTLESDIASNNGTIFPDLAQVVMDLGLKDPGGTNTPTKPTTTNFITVTRYHVEFVRADGRNTPGVDVPFPFDGGVTFTVTEEDGGIAVFNLVRVQAKAEAPLVALNGAQVLSTIANVTFYGTDQAGRAVSVSGSISVNFANYGG